MRVALVAEHVICTDVCVSQTSSTKPFVWLPSPKSGMMARTRDAELNVDMGHPRHVKWHLYNPPVFSIHY